MFFLRSFAPDFEYIFGLFSDFFRAMSEKAHFIWCGLPFFPCNLSYHLVLQKMGVH